MFTKAQSLDVAQKSSDSYVVSNPPSFPAATVTLSSPHSGEFVDDGECTIAAATGPKCHFCGYNKHPRYKCPAKDATCRQCQKKGHFAKVCKSNPVSHPDTVASMHPTLAAIYSPTPPTLIKSSMEVTINGVRVRALIDSCSSESFIHPYLADSLKLR